MATVVTYSNPLSPISRNTQLVEVKTSSDLIRHLEYDTEVYDVVVAKNDVIIDEDFEIVDGDIVAVILVPKGGGGGTLKTVLRIVALVAIAVYAGPMASAFFAQGTAMFYVAQAAIIITGSMIVNAILPPAMPDTPQLGAGDYSTSTTYGWNPAENVYQQGIALPKIFGTHYVTPPVISKYVETYGDTQYLNILYAVSDGQILAIDDIMINDSPISLFTGVSYEYRTGYNTQDVIYNFGDTRYTKTINQALSSSAWRTTQTDGDAVTSITVCLVFPRGVYYANDNGEIVGYSVTVRLEYSSDGVNWMPFGVDFTQNPVVEPVTVELSGMLPSSASSAIGASYAYTTISNSTTSTFRRTYKLENLTPGRYQVRAAFYSEPASSSRYGSDCYFEYIEEVIADDFTYPNTSIFTLRALATDQLSGSMPRVTMRVTQGTSNPADIALAMLEEFSVPSERIDTVKFDEWRDYCNEKGLTCNIYFDQTTNLRKALDIVGTNGRARIEQFGSMFSVIVDKPNEIPVQGFMFGMGNILKDSFKEEFLPIVDRANVIEVTYYNEDYYNEKTILEVSNENYDNEIEENRTQLNLIGCTNRDQAIRQAKYLLNCNRYLTNTVTFDADIDSLVCRFGDVIQVSHDVPAWGASGRIVSGTTNSVTLDRDVEMESGKTYYVQIKSNEDNTINEYLVLYNNEPTDTLTFAGAADIAPTLHDIYSFGEVGKVTKLFRIVRIGTSGNELQRTITAIEYNDDVYNDAEVINTPLISDFGISQLAANDYLEYDKSKNVQVKMNVHWVGFGLSYTISYKHVDDSVFTSVKVNTNNFTTIAKEGVYTITVVDSFGTSDTIEYTVIGKLAPPEAITNLIATQNVDTFRLVWEYATKPIDWSHYEVWSWYGTTYGWFNLGTTASNTFEVLIKSADQHTFKVYSVDTSGVHSVGIETTATPSLDNVTNLVYYYQDSNAYLSWDYSYDLIGIKYEVRKGDSWDNSVLHTIVSDKVVIVDTVNSYHVKAFYVTELGVKLYSAAEESILITGARLADNVVATFDDYNTWLGNKSDTVIKFIDDLSLSFVDNKVSPYGRYESEETIELYENTLSFCSINIDFRAVIGGMYFDDVIDFDAISDLDGIVGAAPFDGISDFDAEAMNLDGIVSQGYRIIPLIGISQNGIDFDDYKVFYPGDYYAKAYKFGLDIYSDDGIARPMISKFEYTVDVPDRIEKGTNIRTDIVGTFVTFAKKFQTKPNTQITVIDSDEDNFVDLTGETESGFKVTVYGAGSRTNLVTYSEDFAQATWTKTNLTVTPNTIASPFGDIVADELVETTSNNVHYLSRNVSFDDASAYSISIYVKPGGRNYAYFETGDVFPTTRTIVNLVDCTVNVMEGSGYIENYGVVPLDNGWCRCYITLTTTSSGVSQAVKFGVAYDENTYSYTGDGVSGIYIFGGQLEKRCCATKYIKTTNSTVTVDNAPVIRKINWISQGY